VVVASSKEIF